KKERLSTDEKLNSMIKNIGEKIAKVSNKPDYRWEFIVIDDSDVVNAFCLPGGKVAFYTGIIPICKDEDGIAVVMGHEVAHALNRHGGERMSQILLAQTGGLVVAELTRKKSELTQSLILAAYGIGVQVGAILPHSRKQEEEADYVGLILAHKAGYNIEKAVDFWLRMKELGNKKPPEFLSTHPSDERRINNIKSWIAEIKSKY
ncbi:MAG: M48 family metallopeptidase, partial [bacterium]|nr:M48 family metallopeptidase [bacterium]